MPYIVCRPLKSTTPEPNPGWTLTRCAACGCECWRTTAEPVPLPLGYVASCTTCALAGRYVEPPGLMTGNPERN